MTDTTASQLRQVREQTVRNHCEAENRQDLDALLVMTVTCSASQT